MICEDCHDTMYHPGGASDDCECTCHRASPGWDPPVGWIDIPRPFLGSSVEQELNVSTHRFRQLGPDDEVTCLNCDCRPGGTIASYPCGMAVPRVLVRQPGQRAG